MKATPLMRMNHQRAKNQIEDNTADLLKNATDYLWSEDYSKLIECLAKAIIAANGLADIKESSHD